MQSPPGPSARKAVTHRPEVPKVPFPPSLQTPLGPTPGLTPPTCCATNPCAHAPSALVQTCSGPCPPPPAAPRGVWTMLSSAFLGSPGSPPPSASLHPHASHPRCRPCKASPGPGFTPWPLTDSHPGLPATSHALRSAPSLQAPLGAHLPPKRLQHPGPGLELSWHGKDEGRRSADRAVRPQSHVTTAWLCGPQDGLPHRAGDKDLYVTGTGGGGCTPDARPAPPLGCLPASAQRLRCCLPGEAPACAPDPRVYPARPLNSSPHWERS